MNTIGRMLFAPLALLTLSSCGILGSSAESESDIEVDTVAGVAVEDAWARTSSRDAESGAVYALLSSNANDAVISASVDIEIAIAAEVHETLMAEDGSLKTQKSMSVALPAGQTVSFEPGGHHIMLLGLVKPLAAGDIITVTLALESGGIVSVDAEVRDDAE